MSECLQFHSEGHFGRLPRRFSSFEGPVVLLPVPRVQSLSEGLPQFREGTFEQALPPFLPLVAAAEGQVVVGARGQVELSSAVALFEDRPVHIGVSESVGLFLILPPGQDVGLALHRLRCGDHLPELHRPVLRRIEKVQFVVVFVNLSLALALRTVGEHDHPRFGLDGRIGTVFGNQQIGLRQVVAVVLQRVGIVLAFRQLLRVGSRSEGHDAVLQTVVDVGQSGRVAGFYFQPPGHGTQPVEVVGVVPAVEAGNIPPVAKFVMGQSHVGIASLLEYLRGVLAHELQESVHAVGSCPYVLHVFETVVQNVEACGFFFLFHIRSINVPLPFPVLRASVPRG